MWSRNILHIFSIQIECAVSFIFGKGWEFLSVHNLRRENMGVIDYEISIKQNLPIISVTTALDLPNGQSVLLVIDESICNKESNHVPLLEFCLREFGIMIDYISHRYGRL
jgi:hypothetical protein